MQESVLLSIPEEGKELYIYLAVSEYAISAVILRQDGPEQAPVYYVSKTLISTDGRYLPLEKLALALMVASRKL